MKYILPFLLTLFTLLAADQNATYVGDILCVACHNKEVQEWKGSHHDLAMQEANDKTVLGDFNQSTFELHGVKSTFYKKNDTYYIRTDGEDGKLHDYKVSYTFGVYPLQQYLLKFPNGGYQVPDIAWDSRSKEEGGQRWYHIHQSEVIKAGDVLHWTGPNFNWDFMCADCHSTNLKKNYDPKTKRYHTTWDVINVSCEACHGPASKHIAWSKNPDKNITHAGFMVSLLQQGRKWQINKETLKAELQDANQSSRYPEIEICAKCHSRRSQLNDDFKAGDPLRNHYLPVMLDENLYFPDGKIQDEVYVYDSFLQSKMHDAGVTCTDCHNPHTLHRKTEGDKVCFGCHKMDTYTSPAHHHHKEGSGGASCVGCHMPARTYMGVDSRNDHSFRVPRPDLSTQIKGLPNACNLCHTDQNASWAAQAVKTWYGKIPVGYQHFAHGLQSLRQNSADAPKGLYDILTSSAPNIAKATATGFLGDYPSRQTYTTILQMLRNTNGDIRRSALLAFESFPPQMRIKETFRMLDDPLLTVRTEAAKQLSAFSSGDMNEADKKRLNEVLEEYKATLIFNADRSESQLALATLYSNLGMPKKAQEAYEEALRIQPMFVPAYVNYADFLESTGKKDEAYRMLQKGITVMPDMAVLHYALGLWYIRDKQADKGSEELEKASKLDGNDARLSYAYAVSIGEKEPGKAINILEEAYEKHTGDIRIVLGLSYYYGKIGDQEKAEVFQKKANELQHFSVR